MSTKTNRSWRESAVTVKQAVANAMAVAKELYAGKGIADLTLEEVEMSEDGKRWLVTLGFFLPSNKPRTSDLGLGEMLRQIQGKTYERRYKLFKVDAQTGKVGAMKIRSV